MQGNGAEESFEEEFRVLDPGSVIYTVRTWLFLFFGNNHWYIQALVIQGTRSIPEDRTRVWEKFSWLPNQFVNINEQSSLPATGYTQDKGSMIFSHSTEATCISRRGWVYLLAKASTWFPIDSAAMRRSDWVNCDCNCKLQRERESNATAILDWYIT
jgi:hypothetical protein